MTIPDGYLSTGILTRPPGTTILQIRIENNTPLLQFQTIYIYDWDSGSPVLLQIKDYFISPNGVNIIEYPLVVTDYSDKRDVTLYEVVYGPTTPGVIVTFSNI